jgi:hypothetical protein
MASSSLNTEVTALDKLHIDLDSNSDPNFWGLTVQHLVYLRLSSSARPAGREDEITFVETVILPTLERCQRLQEEKKPRRRARYLRRYALQSDQESSYLFNGVGLG